MKKILISNQELSVSHTHTHIQIQWRKAEKIIYAYFIISNVQNTQDNMDSCSANVTTDNVFSFWGQRLYHIPHFNHNYDTSRDTILKFLHPLIKKYL